MRNSTQKKNVQESYSLKDVKAVVFPSSPFIRHKSVDIHKMLLKHHVNTVAIWTHMTKQIAKSPLKWKLMKEPHLFISSPMKCDMKEMWHAMYNLGRLKCKKESKENRKNH